VIKKENYILVILKQESISIDQKTKNTKSKEATLDEDDISEDGSYGYLIISNKVYWIPSDYLDLKKVNSETREDFLSKIHLVFEFPLFDGQQFGDDVFSYLREDFLYRKFVRKEDSYFIRKNNSIINLGVYNIVDSVLGSDSVTRFVPYKGIVFNSYKHHGTIQEYEEELIETNVNNCE
jgi:hypothetical protein